MMSRMRKLVVVLILGLCTSVASSAAVPSEESEEALQLFLEESRGLQRAENKTQCYDALIFSDVDYDRRVNTSEYLTFLQLNRPDLDLEFETFADLPLVLQSNFRILACLCLSDPFEEETCCVGDAAHIRNLGAAPDETPTPDQIEYFDQVCFLTTNSILRYEADLPPTVPPQPTKNPTQSPTVTPSLSPTSSPTPKPTTAATDEPTKSPTDGPTAAPSDRPTERPTPRPTPGPTNKPSEQATESPTGVSATPVPTSITLPPITRLPTTAPEETEAPTTGAPTTVAPETGVPTLPPTQAPTSITLPPETDTTSAPTLLEADVVATATYVISVPRTLSPEEAEYEDELRQAMDLLAPQVASELSTTTTGGSTRSLRVVIGRRRLVSLAVDLPTSVDGAIDTVCPDDVSTDRRCEDVSASIGLLVSDEDDISNIRVPDDFEVADYEEALATAIDEGRLQEALFEINEDTVVQILTSGGGDGTDPDRGLGGDGLSGGAVSGIVVAGVLSVLFGVALLARGRNNDDSDEYYLKPGNEMLEEVPEEEDTTQKAGATDGTAAQTPAMAPISPGKADSDAGDSGWSSREGLSSLESSMDEETRASSTGGGESTVASSTLGGTARSADGTRASTTESEASIQMTYSELDQAIQQGDWAAVGVTAALLASQSHDSEQSMDPEKKVNFDSALNSGRAAELDRLVEAGDWAGVVAAAAKYDAQENPFEGTSDQPRSPQGSVTSSQKSDSKVSSNASVASSAGSSGTGPSAFSGSGTAFTGGSGASTKTGTAGSDSNSRVKKLDEIRAEVEFLVARVVPEEKDNIDEMMMQFSGREEELVETLRSMQEREVAQKARLESQKQAKRDAKQTISSKYSEQKAATGADENWLDEIDNATQGKDGAQPSEDVNMDDEVLAIQKSLQEAIEAEDWDRVTETAASLSRRNITSSAPPSDASTGTSISDRSTGISEMVDKGDWDGVVAAASKYAETDGSTTTADSSIADRRSRRQKRLQEEQEALQQADIWSAIAEQTKTDATATESEANQAATVAADWAIARSLSELKAADKSGQLNDSDSGDEDADDKKSDDEGEEGTI